MCPMYSKVQTEKVLNTENFLILSHTKYNPFRLSHPLTQRFLSPLLSRVMFYVMPSMHDFKVDDCLAPRETHRESWDSEIPALSARPNDGIHLLFYGHSWSNVAPIWPQVCNLSFYFPISLCLLSCPFLLSSILCSCLLLLLS